jgi:hypothetical protein
MITEFACLGGIRTGGAGAVNIGNQSKTWCCPPLAFAEMLAAGQPDVTKPAKVGV